MFHKFCLSLLLITPVFSQPIQLRIDTTQTAHQIDPKIYGQFLEHIYHSVNGGVWGEVVWNRSFEERLSPDDWRVHGGVLSTPTASEHESRFMIGSEAWGDYDYFVDLRKTGGDGAVMVGARTYRGSSLTISFEGKQAQLTRAVANRQTRTTDKSTLATADFELQNARWYRVRVRVEGHRLQAFVDDKPLFDTKIENGNDIGQAFVGARSATADYRAIRAVGLNHIVLFDSLPSPARHWKAVGPGELSLNSDQPLNSKFSLKVSGSGGTGVAQDGFAVRKGDMLRGSLWVRGDSTGGISVQLLSDRDRYVLAQNSFPPPSKTWTEYPLALNPEEESPNATLEIVTRGASAVWIDQVSLMPDSFVASGNFRPDLLKAIGDLHPPVIRWPGGSFVANYHWKESIGPQSRRGSKAPAQWDDLDPLSFGIDEFMQLCRRVGAEPLVVINTGAKDGAVDRARYINDARDFVEYTNGPATSKWGKVRAANGHPDPYGVKYWEIDNEIWNLKPDEYVEMLKQFVPAMKQVDPSIKTIACGSGQLGERWGEGDTAVIQQAADVVDYLSVHHYETPEHFADGPANEEKFLHRLGEMIAASKNPGLKLFVSEWNEQSTDWRTGLYAGGILNAFERSGIVTMATPALFLRHLTAPAWDNAFINFDNRSWFPAPNYVVMKLYHDHFAPQSLKVEGNSAVVSVDAAKSADGKRIVVKMVNPGDAAREVSLDLAGFAVGPATVALVAPDSLNARNTLEHPDLVRVSMGPVTINGNTARVPLPRWSVAVLEVNSGAPTGVTKIQSTVAQPDLLTMRNGQPVRDPQSWWKFRRPEILELLETQEYGRMPGGKLAAKITPKFHLDLIDRKALGGKAIRKQVTISFAGVKDSPALHLLLYVPANAIGSAPTVLGLNFNGNQTVDADPGINLTDIWVPDPASPKGPRIKVRAPENTRGSAASQWQVEKIIARGYALATIYCGDIEPDFNGGLQYGVREMFLRGETKPGPDEWGTIGAWAWGLSRALDYLQGDSDINGQKVAVFGFSRLGKAAVWAGGLDQRFAMVISNESGQGGVGLSHRKAGETVEHLNNAFPHWFAANYRQYIGHEDTLPIDGHFVLSLVAPRPAYVASAELDTNSDPKGEFLSAVEASRVYRLLGKEGLGTTEMPALNQPVMGDIGYHVRSGKHDVTAYDWDRYLDFMDRQLGGVPGIGGR